MLFESSLRASAGTGEDCKVSDPRPNKAIVAHLDDLLDTRCGGGQDVGQVARCGFGAIRARARKQEDCGSEIDRLQCQDSMWRELSLEARLTRVQDLARRQTAQYPIEAAAIPCIAIKESMYLEPLMIAYASCSSQTTDQGLGQITFSTFKDMTDNFDFRSRIPPFDQPPYTQDSKLLFEAMALNASLQVEAMAAILSLKLRAAGGNYLKAFEYYNGGKNKRQYGNAVNACLQCMKAGRQGALDCLENAYPGAKRSYESRKRDCGERISQSASGTKAER